MKRFDRIGYLAVVAGFVLTLGAGGCMSEDECTGALCGNAPAAGDPSGDPTQISYPDKPSQTSSPTLGSPLNGSESTANVGAAATVVPPTQRTQPRSSAFASLPEVETVTLIGDETDPTPAAQPYVPTDDPFATPASEPSAGPDFDGVDLPAIPGFERPPTDFRDDLVTPDDLSPEQEDWTLVMRDSINFGLTLGRHVYMEKLSLNLQTFGVFDYETTVASDGFIDPDLADLDVCPFARNFDNGFEPTPDHCAYLATQAKVEAYAEITQVLDENPLQLDIPRSEWIPQAYFWYGQGALSGIEETRVLAQYDLAERGLCNVQPSPLESSYDKGVSVGRQLMIARINAWLAARGQTADYPTMSRPIRVCNANQAVLDEAYGDAHSLVTFTAQSQPLCNNYEPPTSDAALQYAQAIIDYERGVRDGVNAEYSVAAVRVFVVVTCNVSDPLVVDLDGDGLELLALNAGPDFDLYASGLAAAMAWASPDDGLLVLDRNGDGSINDGSELFGNIDAQYADGFEQLAELDRPALGGNGDGLLTSADEAFGALRIWRDANTNGVSEAAELLPFTAVGIDTLPLAAADASLVSAGNAIPRVTWAAGPGAPTLVGDAMLRTAPFANVLR